MSRVHITLLCEDSQTDAFVRRFLKRRNFRRRDITTLPLPAGGQSGEQWVRTRYPAELSAIRRRRRACLVVVTDADTGSTDARRAQLEAECKQQKIPPRENADPVVVVVPRRNIETWLAYLGGTSVDEVTVYPRLSRERDCGPHANRLYDMCRGERLAEPAPPSLREACDEYRKLRR